MGMNFVILVGIVSALWAGFLIVTRNIQFPFPEEEDSVTMVRAAATFDHWRWPSDMHRPSFRATYMKDVSIILIAIFQKIFRHKNGPYSMVAMQGFMNVISALLIFLIANSYWNSLIGLFLGLSFIFSYWPWQLAINMGHINVANMIVLLTIFITTLASGTALFFSPWVVLAGFLLCCLIFCSASSFKYTPLFFSALFFARYRLEIQGGQYGFTQLFDAFGKHLGLNIFLFSALISWLVLSNLFYKQIVSAMYGNNLPRIFEKILNLAGKKMAGREKFSLAHYLTYARSKLKRLNVWLAWIFVFVLLLVNLIGWQIILPVILGFLFALLLLTLPDIKKNLSYYWLYITETQIRKKATFRHWVGYFAKKGVVVDRYYRTGTKLVPRLLMRRIPAFVVVFYLAFICLIISSFFEKQFSLLILTFVVLIVSLLPIIWAELTRCHQGARVYFPSFIGILFFIGFALNHYSQSNLFFSGNFWNFGFLFLGTVLIWNLWQFFNDAFPSRMTIANLIKTLEEKKIKEFYTYRTDYNIPLVGSMDPGILEQYKIHYIDALSEIKNDGWIIIPGTSNKTSLWTTEEMEEGIDFVKDPLLNELLRTKRIEEIATAKFKTFGTSPIWMMDNDINNHRDLIFHEITEEDYFRGYAWLLHTSKLKPLG